MIKLSWIRCKLFSGVKNKIARTYSSRTIMQQTFINRNGNLRIVYKNGTRSSKVSDPRPPGLINTTWSNNNNNYLKLFWISYFSFYSDSHMLDTWERCLWKILVPYFSPQSLSHSQSLSFSLSLIYTQTHTHRYRHIHSSIKHIHTHAPLFYTYVHTFE